VRFPFAQRVSLRLDWLRTIVLAAGLTSSLALVGCAEVRSGQAQYPTGSDTLGDRPLDAAQPLPVADAAFGEEGAVEEDGEEGDADEGEDEDHEGDVEDHEGVDISACLDRGPGSPPHCPQFTWKSPIEGLSSDEIGRKVKTDLASIGPISLGATNRGRLFNGVQMPEDDRWKFSDRGNAWGTQETIDSITRAIEKVHQKHKDTTPVFIGHISSKNGGYLRPHKSHQAGRDVDLSYFLKDNSRWYITANEKNLDNARTWTFVKAFLEDPNTEMILIDTSVQRLLFNYALAQGEDKAFLERVFQVSGKSQRPLIRHVKGHASHIHVRFFSPSAQASGRLAEAHLPKPVAPPKAKRGKGKHIAGKGADDNGKGTQASAKKGDGKKGDADSYVFHRCRSGDTLDSLARKYGVSIQAIKQANGLKTNALKQKQTYRIPRPEGATASASGSGKHRQR
jgi:murein endopeptidase